MSIRAPIAELDSDSCTPRLLAARAAGMARRIRHTAGRSGTIRSAPHGGTEPRVMPIVMPARWAAAMSAVVTSTTVVPWALNRSTTPATVSSSEPVIGNSVSKPCASERSPSSSTETTRTPARRASVTTAVANGSRTGLTSASPVLPAPRMVDSLCQPGPSLPSSSANWAACQALVRCELLTPRTRVMVSSSV